MKLPTPPTGPAAPSNLPKAPTNPLRQYSLLGQADALEANAANSVPLPCGIIRLGQATMLYAAPGTGKTLTTLKIILEAIDQNVVDADQVFYINADDNSEGLATKARLLQDSGAHMLAIGHNGLRRQDVSDTLTLMASNGTAKGAVVVIDTLKKFTNLMDKKSSADFAQICRQFVAAGGTIIALGHTTKSANDDGTPRYQGTTDILEDFDAVYVGMPAKSAVAHQKGVIFKRLKSRGNSPEAAAYGFSDHPDDTYDAKLASVVSMDPEDLDFDAIVASDEPSEDLVEEIRMSIQHKPQNGKMAIAKSIAKMGITSVKTAVKAIEHHEGPDPEVHLWFYTTGGHGKRTYFLHPKPEE